MSRRVNALWTVAGVLATAYYFQWLLQPGHVGVLPLFLLLVIADLFNGFQALSFWLTSLRRPKKRAFAQPDVARTWVDVFIPTLNEPTWILEETVRGAQAMRGANLTIYLLDDGGREEVARLAHRLRVRYIARRSSSGAKAGNINYALNLTEYCGSPYVVVFDSDHVAKPEFLERTLGYFVEDRVALVQTPQVYGNADKGPLTRAAADQQAIFFGPISSGRDGFGASFCCGTNFVVRRDALTRAGGFPEDSVTEDIVLSASLVGLGYEIAFTPEPLTVGLGPEDAKSYVSQQMRWATGCLELLLRRRSLWGPLSGAQRWQYFVATSYWLTGWTILVYLSLPFLRLIFGWQPLNATADGFAAHFLPYFLIAILNLGRFSSGVYSFAGLALTWGSFWIHVRATLAVVRGRPGGFVVTPKIAGAGSPWKPFLPNLVVVAGLAAAALVGLAMSPGPAVFNNITFAAVDALLIGGAVVFACRQASSVQETATVIPLHQQPAADLAEAA